MNQTMLFSFYIQKIDELKKEQEKTLDLMFKHIEPILQSITINQNKLFAVSSLFEQKITKFEEKCDANVKYCFLKYRRELELLYVLLEDNIDCQQLEMITLPSLVDQFINSNKHHSLKEEQTIAFIYIICSSLLPPFHLILHANVDCRLKLSNPESLTFAVNFNHLQYDNERQFLDKILSKPLKIIKEIPQLLKYEFYHQIQLTDVIDINRCLFTCSLIDANCLNVSLENEIRIEVFNCAKIIDFDKLIDSRPQNNNILLNSIQKLTIPKILVLKNRDSQSNLSKNFCLTFAISKKHFLKLRFFFDRLPPELAPFSKYDVFSYGKREQNSTSYYRFATEGYWQHCPQSELMEVYFLCNDSEIEWMSIPAEQYSKITHKIKFWSKQDIVNIFFSKANLVRGIQKKGEIVVIGSGHEYFWRVRDNCGVAVLLKWSVLLKEFNQLERYINIVRLQQKSIINPGNLLCFPHRRIVFNYFSHQFANLDTEALQLMINFVKNGIKKEQNCFTKLCIRYSNQCMVSKKIIPSKYRICGNCGREIINMYSKLKKNIVCLWCLPEELELENDSFKFELSFMWKPSSLENHFNKLLKFREKEQNESLKSLNSSYEANFCEGDFSGNYEIDFCSGEVIKFNQPLENHLVNLLPNLELHIFQKKSYFSSIETVVKVYACKKRKSREQVSQMKSALQFLAENCLNDNEKRRIREQIYRFYHESNYVLPTLNFLTSSHND